MKAWILTISVCLSSNVGSIHPVLTHVGGHRVLVYTAGHVPEDTPEGQATKVLHVDVIAPGEERSLIVGTLVLNVIHDGVAHACTQLQCPEIKGHV